MANPEEGIPTFDAAYRFEGELGLPEGFLRALAKENDWSFVIKLHALYEAALSNVVVHRLGHDALDGPMAAMEMKVKIDFATALGLIGSREKTFITFLSRLRNRCAHNVRDAATFSLRSAVDAMDKNQKANFVNAVFGADEDAAKGEHKQVVLQYPKIFLWHVGIAILALLSVTKEKDRVARELQEEEKRLLATYMKHDEARRPSLMDLFFAESPAKDGSS